MLFSHAPVLRIVQDQVCQFSTLLNQMDVCKPGDPLVESGHSQQFAQHDPRIVEAERLIKIANKQKLAYRFCMITRHENLHSFLGKRSGQIFIEQLNGYTDPKLSDWM